MADVTYSDKGLERERHRRLQAHESAIADVVEDPCVETLDAAQRTLDALRRAHLDADVYSNLNPHRVEHWIPGEHP